MHEIKTQSNRRPFVILNCQNLSFRPHDLCLSVILRLHTKFHVNRTIIRSDLAENDFHYMATLRHIGLVVYSSYCILCITLLTL